MIKMINRLKRNSSKFYSIRDRLGANKLKTYRLKLVWPSEIGVGEPVYSKEQVLPSPGISNIEFRSYLTGHGENTDAHLELSGIPQDKYKESDLKNETESRNEQLFWLIGSSAFVTTSINRKQISFSVSIKRTNKMIPEHLKEVS